MSSSLKRLAIPVGLLLAFALGFGLRGGSEPGPESTAHDDAQATVWTCSMHPQIQLPEPGQCPICGMDLIPLRESADAPAAPRTLTLSESAATIASIQTALVERRAVETIVRTVGKLEGDETRTRQIAAWVPGRIDRLHVDATGVRVEAGQPLFDLYSPELFSAQSELLQAIRSADQLGSSSLEGSRRSATKTVEAARERLRLWGLTAEQVADVVEKGEASEHVTVVAPIGGTVVHKRAVEGLYVKTGETVFTIADLSVLWLQLNVFESDLAWISLGQEARFTTDAFAGEEFVGKVSFVDPVLDPRSRSVRVRVEVPNPGRRLRPGMFARAQVRAAVTEDAGLPLVIPASAPLMTGTRAVVYVADPHEAGRFQGREIVLGERAGDYVVVREGLVAGERVVTNGAFKIDSALQILARGSMMNPPGVGSAAHQHAAAARPAEAATRLGGIPAQFLTDLDPTLGLYFEITEALGRDDLDAARRAAQGIPNALQKPNHSLLPAAGHAPWADLQSRLRLSAAKIATAADLAAARTAYHALSTATIEVVRLVGASGQTDVLLHNCPMAMDGAGADWLQRVEGIANPYYGASMLQCGSLVDTLVTAEGR